MSFVNEIDDAARDEYVDLTNFVLQASVQGRVPHGMLELAERVDDEIGGFRQQLDTERRSYLIAHGMRGRR